MDPKEFLSLRKDHASNSIDNQEPPSIKIIPIIKKTNKVNKRVTFDPDSTLLPSYTKVPLNESGSETSKFSIFFYLTKKCKKDSGSTRACAGQWFPIHKCPICL